MYHVHDLFIMKTFVKYEIPISYFQVMVKVKVVLSTKTMQMYELIIIQILPFYSLLRVGQYLQIRLISQYKTDKIANVVVVVVFIK